ncbi:MAG: GTPase ObgE [Candidatus Spechtbacterales bacterium]
MAFVDEVTISVKAGNGGNGVVRWRSDKNEERGGPNGGNGGKGGNVYARAVRDVHLLSKYRTQKAWEAKRGKDGEAYSLIGETGEDLELLVPVGSILTNLTTGEKFSLLKEDERVLLLRGGRGGRGNESFKSSTNQAPREATNGMPGEVADFYIEVRLIADIGLVGMPSAGKSSLLNELSRAKAKVGAYPFTTLEPNLGDSYGYIISDIPGLIEGSAHGKGLGHKFLRHIKRTKVLAHLISLENDDILGTYNTIRKELEEYDPELLKKKEVIILTKTDVVDDAVVGRAVAELKALNPNVIALSVYDDESIKRAREVLITMVDEHKEDGAEQE